MTETVTNGGYRKKELCEKDRGSTEDARELPACIILCGLEYSKERGLSDVSEPNLGSVSKDRNKGRVEDTAPRDKRQASDRVSEDAEGLN